jgi:hypothetical protein
MRETLAKWKAEGKRVCVYFVNEKIIGRYKAGYIIDFDDADGTEKGIIFRDSYSGAVMAIPYSAIQAVSEYPTP